MRIERKTTGNTGLAKVAVQYSADSFVDNQSLVLSINICGKIASFAKPQTASNLYVPDTTKQQTLNRKMDLFKSLISTQATVKKV